MPQLHTTPNTDLENAIQSMEKLDNSNLENLLSRLSILLARRKAPNLPAREAELLSKINQSPPESIQQRHRELMEKLQANALSDPEHQELIGIIDQLELANAERMQAIVELSELRGVSVDKMMAQLGIHPLAPQLSNA